MQSLDFEANQEEQKEQLENDGSTPLSPVNDQQELIPEDHPVTDSNIDLHEWYDTNRSIAGGFIAPRPRGLDYIKEQERRWREENGPVRIVKFGKKGPKPAT